MDTNWVVSLSSYKNIFTELSPLSLTLHFSRNSVSWRMWHIRTVKSCLQSFISYVVFHCGETQYKQSAVDCFPY